MTGEKLGEVAAVIGLIVSCISCGKEGPGEWNLLHQRGLRNGKT